jgi:hypothetical protein
MKLWSDVLITVAVILLHVSEAKYDWKTKRVTKGKNRLIFKGTKWCGRGNNAMSFNDLGK